MTRRSFTTLAVIGVVVITFLAIRLASRRWDEGNVLIGTGVELSLKWRAILPVLALRSDKDWSQLYLEVPGLYVGQTMDTTFSDNDTQIEGYLTTTDGRIIQLNHRYVIETQYGRYLCLSSTVLRNSQEHYEFREIALRSNRAVRTERIIWISYDPSSTLDGLPPPNTLIYGP